jgi:hypothetical protein
MVYDSSVCVVCCVLRIARCAVYDDFDAFDDIFRRSRRWIAMGSDAIAGPPMDRDGFRRHRRGVAFAAMDRAGTDLKSPFIDDSGTDPWAQMLRPYNDDDGDDDDDDDGDDDDSMPIITADDWQGCPRRQFIVIHHQPTIAWNETIADRYMTI